LPIPPATPNSLRQNHLQQTLPLSH
jgi:hypothetical protein